jgi:hypothetical protein
VRSREILREEGRRHAVALIEYGAEFGSTKDDVVREIEAQIETADGWRDEIPETLYGAAEYFRELAVALEERAAARATAS